MSLAQNLNSTEPHQAEKPKIRFPSSSSGASDSTLNEEEQDRELAHARSAPVETPFQCQLREAKFNPDKEKSKKSAIIGGSHAQDKERSIQIDAIEEVDADIPLTMIEVVEDDGDQFTLLTFADGDNDDPFNWPRGKKAFISVLLCMMTLFIGLATTAYSSGIGSMTEEFGVSEEIGQLGLFLFNIVCAIAPLFLAPFCELVGRRVIYAGSFLCFSIMFIGLALGKNIGTILVCRALLGLFGCVGTILVGGTFSDMYVSEQRAVPIASFSWVAILGTVGAPIYAGFIDQTIGWRWVQGVQGIANVPLLIIILFFLKETRGEVMLQKRARVLNKATGTKKYVSAIDLDARNIKDLLHAASVKAIKMLATEVVVFAFGIWIAFAWFLTFLFLSVIPITFEEKRGWSHGVGGLPYISLALGVTIAYGANFLQMRYYNKLVKDPTVTVVPEHRLIGAMIGGPFLPIGLYIYSFTQYGDLPWIGPVVGLAPIAIGIFFIFEGCYNYTSDCYGANSSSAIAGQGLMRNTLGAVSPLFASQFFHKVGSQYAGLVLAIIATLLTGIPFAFYKYGHVLRKRSAQADCPEDNLRRPSVKRSRSTPSVSY